jgi:DNA mismatch repair protein MutS2
MVVPVDIVLDPGYFAMVITGPNTGGKTVSLKTAGLLVLMAQSGMAIPAQAGSELSIFEGVYADIGDEQSIEQSLSTFSGHIKTIIRILGSATPRSLVILDELGAGTDPQEGAALATAILGHLISRPVTTLVATHYPELKAYAHASHGVVNASLEFDLESLSPTYHLVIGLPGRSNALAIARRLGLPEGILQQAAGQINPADLQVEDLLDEIHRQRDLVRQDRIETDQALQDVRVRQEELRERLERIEDERRQVIEEARERAEVELESMRDELREVRRLLAQARQPLDALEPVEAQLDELAEQVETPVERRLPDAGDLSPAEPQRVRLGDRVRLRGLGTLGVVGALGEGEAEVHVGSMRIRTRLADLERAPPGPEEAAQGADAAAQGSQAGAAGGRAITLPPSPGLELNLRGRRLDDALEALEGYLDAAFLAGIPFARIIHGKGTGKLRTEVRRVLGRHPHVASFEAGGSNEGGDGVTIVRFAS